jgi:hypothetical protein
MRAAPFGRGMANDNVVATDADTAMTAADRARRDNGEDFP